MTEPTSATPESHSPAPESAFLQAVGFTIDEVTATSLQGHLELGPQHHTPWGIVHGGVYATVIESAASVGASHAVEADGMFAVGLMNTTHFVRAIQSGRVLVAATALNQGRTQQLWQVDCRDDSGRLLAHGEVRLQNTALNPERQRRRSSDREA